MTRERTPDRREGRTGDGSDRPRVKVTDRRRVAREALGGPGGPAPGTEAREGPADAGEPGAEAPEPATEAPEGSQAGELEQARRQAAEYLDHLQRLKAEFDNYRKRVLREQTRAVEMAVEPFVGRLLEVLDEFELALVAAEQKPELDKFLRGVEMVYAKLVDILRAEGVERIEAEGKPFDPEQHEALLQSEGGEGEPFVADVLRTGYRLKGRVIRPAGVKVARR